MRTVLRLLWGLLPASGYKNRVGSLLGYSIHPSAVVSINLIVKVRAMTLGPHAVLGSFNVLRNMQNVTIGESSIVGQWNWISAAPEFSAYIVTSGDFHLGREAALTSRHYVDCSGGVDVGQFATVAGVRSSFITHGIDVETSRQQASPISIGPYSIVGSCSKITPGASVPSCSMIAMGAVVGKGLEKEYTLYGGVPARELKPLSRDGRYFARELGPVHV